MRRRRMTRAFTNDPVDRTDIESICDQMLRGPSAGNTQPLDLLVLEGDELATYWETTLPPSRRDAFPWPGLLNAPVLIIPYVTPDAYVARYSEADKAHTGLGDRTESWTVPYWWVDGGAAVQTALLSAASRGLGACFFGQFEHENAVCSAFGVPDGRRALGTIALGQADIESDRPSVSASRPKKSSLNVVHWGSW